MKTVLVWVMMAVSLDGSFTMYDNLYNQDSCERLRTRIMNAGTYGGGRRAVEATCTEVHKVVLESTPPVINVLPASAPAPTVKNTVVVRPPAK